MNTQTYILVLNLIYGHKYHTIARRANLEDIECAKAICMVLSPDVEEFGKFQTAKIVTAEWRVLLSLAYKGPQTMYEISDRDRNYYPMIFRATKELQSRAWVKIIGRGTSEKNVSTKIYSLTPEGLLWIFSKKPRTLKEAYFDPSGLGERLFTEEPPELKDLRTQDDVYLHLVSNFNVDRIAETNPNLFPLIFGKWNEYKKSRVSLTLKLVFAESAEYALHEYYFDDRGLRSRFGSIENIFAYESYRAVLDSLSSLYAGRPVEQREAYLNEILSIYEQNPEVRDILDQIMSELETNSKGTLNFLKKIMTRAHRYGKRYRKPTKTE